MIYARRSPSGHRWRSATSPVRGGFRRGQSRPEELCPFTAYIAYYRGVVKDYFSFSPCAPGSRVTTSRSNTSGLSPFCTRRLK